jgi:hypothetical protein
LGFQYMMPNMRLIEVHRFAGKDDALEASLSISRLEAAIPKKIRPDLILQVQSRESLIEDWWLPITRKIEFFQHSFPHERSDLSHLRKRLGDKLERLLAESLRVAHEAGALRSQDLKRVTIDTTVQPKAISFPTDAKLLHAAIKGLNRLARRHGVRLRQSYCRVAKAAAMMAGRYAHAKQFRRHQRELRILRSRLGRAAAAIGSGWLGQAGGRTSAPVLAGPRSCGGCHG